MKTKLFFVVVVALIIGAVAGYVANNLMRAQADDVEAAIISQSEEITGKLDEFNASLESAETLQILPDIPELRNIP